eukprot:147208_1
MATSLTSDVQSQLNQLWKLQESDRKMGTKLLMKILGNLSNNLSESAKYGNLNFTEISVRLSRCKPAFALLLRAGFKQSNDEKRLIWTYDDDAIELLYDVYNALQTRIAIDLSVDQPMNPIEFTNEDQAKPISRDENQTKTKRCMVCKFKNKENSNACTMCQTSTANQSIHNGWQCTIATCANINIPTATSCVFCESEPGDWLCSACTFKNPSMTKKCLVCDEPQPPTIRLSFESDSRMCIKRGDNTSSIIDKCECLQRIRVAMKHFDLLSDGDGKGDENKEIFVSFCNETYKNKHLLDDYCHVIKEHSNDLNQIKDELIDKYQFDACDVNQCHKVKRYYGRRKQQRQEEKTENDALDDDNAYRFYVDLFDQLHHFIYHLYDVGLRTEVVQNEPDDDGKEIDLSSIDRAFAERIQIISQKTEQCPDDDRFRSFNNKYTLQTQVDEPKHQVISSLLQEKTFLDRMYKFLSDNNKNALCLMCIMQWSSRSCLFLNMNSSQLVSV